MDIKLNVHSATPQKVGAIVQLAGADVRADVDSLEVQLTSIDSLHGSITLRFIGADVDEATAKFVVGQTVTWTI